MATGAPKPAWPAAVLAKTGGPAEQASIAAMRPAGLPGSADRGGKRQDDGVQLAGLSAATVGSGAWPAIAGQVAAESVSQASAQASSDRPRDGQQVLQMASQAPRWLPNFQQMGQMLQQGPSS